MVFSNINEAWNFLISYQHKKYTVGYITYFEWFFYDKEKNVYKLEHEAGIVRRYVINNWFLFKNHKENCIVGDIVSMINLHKEDIQSTNENLNKNYLLIDNVNNILGKYNYYVDSKVIWDIVLEKIHLKIEFVIYMDNDSIKNISLDILEKNKSWKKSKVDKTGLLAFLEKNKRKIVVKSKSENDLVDKIAKLNLKRNLEDKEDDDLISKFSKVKLSRDENISKKYSKLFIQMDKEKRYEIQACKKF